MTKKSPEKALPLDEEIIKEIIRREQEEKQRKEEERDRPHAPPPEPPGNDGDKDGYNEPSEPQTPILPEDDKDRGVKIITPDDGDTGYHW